MTNIMITDKTHGQGSRGKQRENILDSVNRWLGVRDNKGISIAIE
jgi:hypothetical protein